MTGSVDKWPRRRLERPSLLLSILHLDLLPSTSPDQMADQLRVLYKTWLTSNNRVGGVLREIYCSEQSRFFDVVVISIQIPPPNFKRLLRRISGDFYSAIS